MPAYILKSLLTLRDEITERLMQNSEFRALQSLQRSIDEVMELSERETASHFVQVPKKRVQDADIQAEPANATDTIFQTLRPNVVTRVTPAHFAAAKRII